MDLLVPYGRLGRVLFVFYFIMFLVLMCLLLSFVWRLIPAPLLHTADPYASVRFLASFGIVAAWLYLTLMALIKRLHDINKGGFWLMLACVFFVLSAIMLALVPGDEGENQFGEPPDTLIESASSHSHVTVGLAWRAIVFCFVRMPIIGRPSRDRLG
jgi:uncharacterized membrane protein YhaH (DUF805 family)